MVDKKEKRTFKVASSNVDVTGGRYKSFSPDAAAKKAGTKLFKKVEKSTKHKAKKEIVFTIQETTNGNEKKSFKYSAKRVKLAKPKTIFINGTQIVYKYKTMVKALK